jgi:hypothetical protein
MDPKRVWSLDFLLEFVDYHCSPTPYIYAVIAAMGDFSKENSEFKDVLICKDCMTWAAGLATMHHVSKERERGRERDNDNDNDNDTEMVWTIKEGKKMGRRVMRGIKHHFLPMDAVFLFVHAPSEEYQTEYRMMCRLLSVLVEGRSIYHMHSSTVLQSLLHRIETKPSLLKGIPKKHTNKKKQQQQQQHQNTPQSSSSVVAAPSSSSSSPAPPWDSSLKSLRQKRRKDKRKEEKHEEEEEEEEEKGEEKEEEEEEKEEPGGRTIAVRIASEWYKLTGKRLLVRGHPRLAQYIRKINAKSG